MVLVNRNTGRVLPIHKLRGNQGLAPTFDNGSSSMETSLRHSSQPKMSLYSKTNASSVKYHIEAYPAGMPETPNKSSAGIHSKNICIKTAAFV
jgi:hypothetical protein